MIRFALIVASVLGFALTAAVGNLLTPLLRALVPPEKEAEVRQMIADGVPFPTLMGYCRALHGEG